MTCSVSCGGLRVTFHGPASTVKTEPPSSHGASPSQIVTCPPPQDTTRSMPTSCSNTTRTTSLGPQSPPPRVMRSWLVDLTNNYSSSDTLGICGRRNKFGDNHSHSMISIARGKCCRLRGIRFREWAVMFTIGSKFGATSSLMFVLLSLSLPNLYSNTTPIMVELSYQTSECEGPRNSSNSERCPAQHMPVERSSQWRRVYCQTSSVDYMVY